MNRREQQLQQAIVQALHLAFPYGSSPVLWFHPPNGGGRSKREGAIFKSMGVRAGIPDLVFVWAAGAGLIELKAGGGSLSQSQRLVRRQCRDAGIRYAVATSLAEVLQALEEWGVPSPRVSTGSTPPGTDRPRTDTSGPRARPVPADGGAWRLGATKAIAEYCSALFDDDNHPQLIW